MGNTTSKNTLQNANYRLELDRLKTFQILHWPFSAQAHPIDLAKAGFYYTGIIDAVKCPWCGVIVMEWKIYDNPLVEHQRYGPRCPFVIDRTMI